MQNPEDEEIGFDEELMDDSYDAEFDDQYDDFGDVEEGEWAEDSYEEEFGDAEPLPQEQKKRAGLSFNTIVIGGAVVLGLGVFGYQLMTTKPVSTGTKFASALNMSGATDGPIFGQGEDQGQDAATIEQKKLSEQEEKNKSGFLFDPEVLDSVEGGEDLPMPSAISQVSEGQEDKDEIIIDDIEEMGTKTSPEFVAAVEPPVTQAPVLEQPMEQVDTNDSKADEIIIEEEEVSEPSLSLQQSLQVEETSKEEAAPVVEEMVITTPQPDTKTETVSIGATPALSAADMTTIEKKLDMIVSRLDRVESQMAEVKEANNSEVDTISKSVKDLKKEVANLAITKPAAPVKTVKKADPAPKVATSKPSSSNSKVTWELRAAQPGKAWVSKAGQKELTPVTVGDDLSGIGRITSITYVSNRWIVQGTSGKITQ
ncbi:MAG TPA: hypothetical protein PLK85_04380 [Alphaproteobacteria bacterium]|nr:hypothetical protein [Alphaproteobacteria bacterium]